MLSPNRNHHRTRQTVIAGVQLRDAGKNVIIVLPTPEYRFHVQYLVVKSLENNVELKNFALEIENYNVRSGEVREILQEICSKYSVKFVDLKEIYCKVGFCVIVDDSKYPYYTDSNHLSYNGSQYFSKEILILFSYDKFYENNLENLENYNNYK